MALETKDEDGRTSEKPTSTRESTKASSSISSFLGVGVCVIGPACRELFAKWRNEFVGMNVVICAHWGVARLDPSMSAVQVTCRLMRLMHSVRRQQWPRKSQCRRELLKFISSVFSLHCPVSRLFKKKSNDRMKRFVRHYYISQISTSNG